MCFPDAGPSEMCHTVAVSHDGYTPVNAVGKAELSQTGLQQEHEFSSCSSENPFTEEKGRTGYCCNRGEDPWFALPCISGF